MIFALWKSAVNSSRLISCLHPAVDVLWVGLFSPQVKGKVPIPRSVLCRSEWRPGNPGAFQHRSVWRKHLCLAVPQFQRCQCFLAQPINTFSVVSVYWTFSKCVTLHISEVPLRASSNRRFRFKLQAVHLLNRNTLVIPLTYYDLLPDLQD